MGEAGWGPGAAWPAADLGPIQTGAGSFRQKSVFLPELPDNCRISPPIGFRDAVEEAS